MRENERHILSIRDLIIIIHNHNNSSRLLLYALAGAGGALLTAALASLQSKQVGSLSVCLPLSVQKKTRLDH